MKRHDFDSVVGTLPATPPAGIFGFDASKNPAASAITQDLIYLATKTGTRYNVWANSFVIPISYSLVAETKDWVKFPSSWGKAFTIGPGWAFMYGQITEPAPAATQVSIINDIFVAPSFNIGGRLKTDNAMILSLGPGFAFGYKDVGVIINWDWITKVSSIGLVTKVNLGDLYLMSKPVAR
jgi:hypothetical protein